MKLSEKTQEIGVNPGFPPAQVTVAFASPATETPGMWPGHAHSCPRGCPGWGCSWLTSREQAERAVGYIGDNCTLVETDTNDHVIHTVHSDVYIDAVNSLLK